MPNYIKKEFPIAGTWIAPAGVTQVTFSLIDMYSNLISNKTDSTGALARTGAVFTWGQNDLGQLGDNTIVNKSSPVPVVGGHSFIQTSAGGNKHMVALKADGSAWGWGGGTSGQLGDNTILSKSVPVAAIGGHSFFTITGSGNGYTMALKIDGSVWAWGSGGSGNLGDGTAVSKSSPVAAIGGHSFISIDASGQTSIALKADGSVWTWGANGSGQLGDNTTVGKSSPVLVIGGHSFIQIATGNNHCMALKADGSVWTWGLNFNGSLGNGTASTSSSSPIAVIGGHSFVQMSAGTSTSIALKSDGSAWCWGSGTSGQLGDNTTVNKSSPVAVVGGHLFTQVTGGFNVSTALKADGSVWTWGNSGTGNQGDNTIVAKSSPVPIVGGLVFQSGSKIILQRSLSVVPGTSYNISAFLTQIGTQVINNVVTGNDITIVIEYIV